MSINKLISIKEPILEAMKDMGVDITRDRATFAMWAVRAEKDIGSYYSYKRKRAVLDIIGCCAELPCDAAFMKVAILGDHGCDCSELVSSLSTWATSLSISSNETFLIIDKPDSNNYSLCGVKWQIQDNSLLFNKNLNGQKVTVEYLGLEEDCDGFVMVNKNHKEAIIEYIMWKFARRSRFSAIKMDHTDVRTHQQEYFRLASDARATDALLTDSERQEIVGLLHDPLSGFGLDIGISESYNW